MDCDLFFQPVRLEDGNAVLQPVLISDDGQTRLVANKVVIDVEKALSMYAGFTLAAAVDIEGGVEGLKAAVEEHEAEKEAEETD